MAVRNALVPQSGDVNQHLTLYRLPEWEEEETQEALLDLAELRAMLFRQRYWIMSAMVICLLMGVAATMMATRIYRSTASIQVEENTPILTEGQKAVDPTLMGGAVALQRYLQSQVDVLRSRYMAERVVDQLRLHEDPTFIKAAGLADQPLPSDALRGAAIGMVQGGIQPELAPGSQVIFIHFQSPSPAVSAAVANAYAENLITGNLERKYQASAYAREFLAKELERAKQRLEASERAALDYARSAQIVDTGGPAPASGEQVGPSMGAGSLPAANLARMNADLASARTLRIQAEEKWRTAAGMPIMSLPEVVQNGSIQSLQSERAGLVATLNKLEQTFTPDYPDVIRAKSSIATIDAEIQSRARQIRDSIRQQYVTAARQESAMAGRMGGLKAATLHEQDRRVQFDLLNREAATNRSLYDSLMQRYREVSTAAGVTNNNISILDKALPNGNPVSPKPLKNMFLALVAGLGLGFGIAFLRDRMNNAVRTPDEVPAKLGLPLLGTTPVVLPEAVASDLALSSSGLSEAYHSIRSAVEFSSTTGAPRSLLITSSRPGEGKSTTALAMAADFAQVGLRVLLVDADLRRPSLHKTLGLTNENGFVHVLTGRMPLEACICDVEGVAFLPSGAIPPNPTELLVPNNVRSFLKTASARYDMVIFDGPPVMGLADSPQMSSAVESTVLVLETAAPRSQARTVIRRLRAAKANVIGIVLTKFSSKHAGYGTDYGYYYEYSEGSGRKGRQKAKQLEAQ